MLTLPTHFLSSTSRNLFLLLPKPQHILPLLNHATTMSISLSSHAFAGNPIRFRTPKPTSQFSPNPTLESLKSRILSGVPGDSLTQFASPDFKVLPFRKGRPLATSGEDEAAGPRWRLRWMGLDECWRFLGELSEDRFLYLGWRDKGNDDGVVYWAIDVSKGGEGIANVKEEGWCFVELRTLMVATDWDDQSAMGELAIAGHGRALLEWHGVSRFCGNCGWQMVPVEAGRRKQCSNEQCKKRIYPRVDPVVIMLVIDRENDSVLLSRQSRFVPRMWSCLAGFLEPGESLEEAVRRETWEETGIEVGEVVYHSSQPWPVGPSSMPCQLMVGFYAYARSREVNVDKEELEDAQWHIREDVKKALTFAEYKKAQQTAAAKVNQMCKGVEKGQSLSADFNVESGELAPMFFPGPFAIAHHLISSWAFQDPSKGLESQFRHPSPSMSNL
ncbi:hypothetical protein MLD38_006837 [Melastoma candidum]|uniref:Uncharacterized protein n=1 Tax=Melastoma candidum TaxID=119954 RepID=A0ACB9RQD7_9MYRT|nr:hypothetical protein MLD38_006837 [Melastoma candidum]